MVNFASFGPLTGGKNTALIANSDDQSAEKTCRVKLIEEQDLESNMAPLALGNPGGNRRGKGCGITCVVDACAILALVLVVVSTVCLLYKVWWVRTEMDQIAPAVAQLAADINRLKAESASLEGENAALLGALTRKSDMDDDRTELLEDISQDALNQLSDEQQHQVEVVDMVFHAAGVDSSVPADSGESNITDFYKSYLDAVNDLNSGKISEEPDILQGKQILNTSGMFADPYFIPSLVSTMSDEDDSSQEVTSSEIKNNADVDDDDEDASSDDENEDVTTKKATKQSGDDSDNEDRR